MCSPSINKLFLGKTFYLDLKLHRNQEELIKDLKKLGGKVESFLSKDVTHVLTDRKEFSKRESLASDGTIKNTPSRSSSKMYASPLSYFNSPAYSPVNDYGRVRSPVSSRGLTLVQKAQQKREGTTDILEVCTQWNIKVIHIEVVTALIHKYKVDYTKRMNLYREQQRAIHGTETAPYKFSLPFIKVEDINKQYKPAYKEFKSWQKVVDPDLQAAFSTVMQDIGCLSSSTTPENSSTGVLREFNTDLRLRNSINFKIHQLKPEEESLHTVKRIKIDQENQDTKETYSISYNGERRKGLSSVSLKNPNDKPVKKLKKRYCEICRHSYTDLDEHLRTEAHKKYLDNPNNFRKIEEIMQTLPSASQFLNKWRNQEKEVPVTRHISLHGWMSQFENSEEIENAEDSAKVTTPSVLPIPQWQTVGNCFGNPENIDLDSNLNHEYYNNMLSCLPLTNTSYISSVKTNDVSMYCEKKSLFNTSPTLSVPCVGDNYPERKEFSDQAINLCTRNPEHVAKDAYNVQSATELYNCNSDELVCASCSSIELSSKLPYLEDSIEKFLPKNGGNFCFL